MLNPKKLESRWAIVFQVSFFCKSSHGFCFFVPSSPCLHGFHQTQLLVKLSPFWWGDDDKHRGPVHRRISQNFMGKTKRAGYFCTNNRKDEVDVKQMWWIVIYIFRWFFFEKDDDLVWSPFWETSGTCGLYQRRCSPFNLSTSLPAKQCLIQKDMLFFLYVPLLHQKNRGNKTANFFECIENGGESKMFHHQELQNPCHSAAKRCEAKTGDADEKIVTLVWVLSWRSSDVLRIWTHRIHWECYIYLHEWLIDFWVKYRRIYQSHGAQDFRYVIVSRRICFMCT